jgi:hypothetical protein
MTKLTRKSASAPAATVPHFVSVSACGRIGGRDTDGCVVPGTEDGFDAEGVGEAGGSGNGAGGGATGRTAAFVAALLRVRRADAGVGAGVLAGSSSLRGGNGSSSVGSEAPASGEAAGPRGLCGGGAEWKPLCRVVPHRLHSISLGWVVCPQVGHSRAFSSENCTVGSSAIIASL